MNTSNTQPPAEQKPATVNPRLVKLLEGLLEQAKSGHLKGVAIVMVKGPTMMGPVLEPPNEWALEYLGGCTMITTMLGNSWNQQVMAQMQQAGGQAKGQAQAHRQSIARATAADMDAMARILKGDGGGK